MTRLLPILLAAWYLGNPLSMVLHKPDCRHIQGRDRAVKYWDWFQARRDGYRPCEICNPRPTI